MDLSKLPQVPDSQADAGQEPSALSSPQQQAPRTATVPPPAAQASGPVAGTLANAWFSLGLGVFLLLYQPRFLQWVSSELFHTKFDDFQLNGQVVPYPSVPEFWSDLGPTLFGIVLIADGLLLFTRRKNLLAISLLITVLATCFNLVWVIVSYSRYGLAVISLLAVVVGGYLAIEQWSRLLAWPGRERRPATTS